jgi:hypothetical protein
MLNDRLANRIIVLVTIIWAVNFLVGALPQFGFRTNSQINFIFMTIVGGAFLSKRKNYESKIARVKKILTEDEPDPEVPKLPEADGDAKRNA